MIYVNIYYGRPYSDEVEVDVDVGIRKDEFLIGQGLSMQDFNEKGVTSIHEISDSLIVYGDTIELVLEELKEHNFEECCEEVQQKYNDAMTN